MDKKEKPSDKKWMSFAEAKIMEELYNQMHNEWIDAHCSCGKNPNCIICNSLKK